jgi:uncharacterized protein YuzE
MRNPGLTSSLGCDTLETKMRIRYFHNIDTAVMEFSALKVAETKEISENIYVDLDASRNLVAMTIEHARQQARMRRIVNGVQITKCCETEISMASL